MYKQNVDEKCFDTQWNYQTNIKLKGSNSELEIEKCVLHADGSVH